MLRLKAQRLIDASATGVVEGTRHLLAVQAQDARAARLALRVRTAATHASEVDRALSDERSLVITWVNRGTLHLIAAEDEPLLHALTTPQLLTTSDRQLRNVGISPAQLDRGVSLIYRLLGAEGPRTRGQLREVLEAAGVPVVGEALTQILFRATLDGMIVRGPLMEGEHAFVLAADWLGNRPRIDRDVALGELARRYLAAHGPADERDLAKWAQLPLRDARAGFRLIGRQLHEREDGLVDLHQGCGESPLPPPRLLGGFDPLLLGWRSRDLVLDEPARVITPNGIFRAIVLVDGRAVGTWTLANERVRLQLWSDHDSETAHRLEREAAAVEAFLTSAQPLPASD